MMLFCKQTLLILFRFFIHLFYLFHIVFIYLIPKIRISIVTLL